MTYDEAKTRIREFGIYRHYKGGYYQVLAIAIHSDTGQILVIYKNIVDTRITWVRPASTWFDDVGNGKKRFELYQPKKENGNV